MNIPEEADATPDEAFDIGRIRGYDDGRKEALREARAAIAELLADPGIYATAAIAGVTSALAKLDGVPL